MKKIESPFDEILFNALKEKCNTLDNLILEKRRDYNIKIIDLELRSIISELKLVNSFKDNKPLFDLKSKLEKLEKEIITLQKKDPIEYDPFFLEHNK